MKIVRVHNPSGLMATKQRRKRKVMARRKRRTTNRRRSVARATATNPRRHRRRRRHNPVIVARRARASNPRRRHHRRRRNPSGMRIGQIFKDMVYGAGGAIATRVIAGAFGGLVPASFAASPITPAAVQAAAAVIPVRWLGKKFLGPQQGDLMMMGGLISAGLALADAYFPNAQAQLTGIIRAPISLIPGASAAPGQGAAPTAMGRYADVEEVPDSVFAGLGRFSDVEDVPAGIFGNI